MTDTPQRDLARAECAKAYYKMKATDKAFSAALCEAYGKNAGDMRYHTEKQTPEIRALGTLYQISADDWSKAFNAIPA
jgi:hypothetical protein